VCTLRSHYVRRVLNFVLQVPSIAIEDVYVWNNTSVIVDEVLAHRIGLVPLNVDPTFLDMKSGTLPTSSFASSSDPYPSPSDSREQATDRNTLVFKLQVNCTRKPGAPKGSALPADELYDHHQVTAGDLVWAPAGDQEEAFKDMPLPGPTNPDIVLAKLRPGQSVDMELHAVKGVGKDHAKFSPVGSLSLQRFIYRHI
jgi:DNA-directed RNA polymerases I and III subunit RPAC1